jgi:hypothetical protein
MIYLLIFLAVREVQCSWYLGPGHLGPNPHFGRGFYLSNNIAYLYLQQYITLSPKDINISDWTYIEIDDNSSIDGHNLILPVDLDLDGDLDLCAGYGNQVVWYEQYDTLEFRRHFIENFYFGDWGTVWPVDLDQDNDSDIVVAGEDGLGWYKNENLVFSYHSIDDDWDWAYVRYLDVDNDKDIDLVASCGGWGGNVYLFENDTLTFNKRSLNILEAWRINVADFNNDGFQDIQTTTRNGVAVYLNDKNGNFTETFYGRVSGDADGSWPSDFDADGDMDIMGNGRDGSFCWFENNGTGEDFEPHELTVTTGNYGDGGMACDLNLDARNDIIGGYRAIGWLEQLPNGNFEDHFLGDAYSCHWVYGFPIGRGPCESMSFMSSDIIFSDDGKFGLYHNQMITTYAEKASLESSILEAESTSVEWIRFGWHNCIPAGFKVQYRVRTDSSIASLIMKPWSAPFVSPGGSGSHYDTLIGFKGRYAQYKIEIEKTSTSEAVLHTPIIDTVWIEYIYSPLTVEELTGKREIELIKIWDKIFYTVPKELNLSISIYDVAGRVVKEIWKGRHPKGSFSFSLPKKSGIYIVHLRSKGVISEKCVVVK